jgi:hypothetical protein
MPYFPPLSSDSSCSAEALPVPKIILPNVSLLHPVRKLLLMLLSQPKLKKNVSIKIKRQSGKSRSLPPISKSEPTLVPARQTSDSQLCELPFVQPVPVSSNPIATTTCFIPPTVQSGTIIGKRSNPFTTFGQNCLTNNYDVLITGGQQDQEAVFCSSVFKRGESSRQYLHLRLSNVE